ASGRRSVDRMRTVVVLPAPLGPSRASTVPSSTSRSSPSSTGVGGAPRRAKDLRSPSAVTIAVIGGPFGVLVYDVRSSVWDVNSLGSREFWACDCRGLGQDGTDEHRQD